MFELSNCPICTSKNFRIIGKAKDFYNDFEGEFTYSKCSNCGFIYTNPRPTKDKVHLLYPDNAGYLTPKKISPISEKTKFLLIKKFNYSNLNSNYKFKFLLPFLSTRKLKIQSFPNFIDGGNFLDIGSSYGDHLYKMKSIGWNCKGIELNKNSANYAISILNLDIKSCLIEDYSESEKFNIVHMGMVLEHIIDPKEILNKVNKLLKDDGVFIFSVPNITSFEGVVFRNYWYSLHLPMHLNHFNRKSIKNLLKDFGFNNIKIYHQNDPNDVIISLKYFSQDYKFFYPLYFLLKFKYVRKLIVMPFMQLLGILNLSSRMTIYAKK